MSDYMYVPFHVHSMQSNGTTNVDSVTNFRDYVKAAKEYGMPALGFSEHGNIFEWLHKKEEIEAAGMKYLHCIEAYITENLHHADCEEPSVEELPEEYEDGQEKCKKTRDNYHCVLIARNYDGVKELNRLVSKSFDRSDGHFYYMPRITIDELITTSDNIIITTACLGGILSRGSSTIKEKFLTFLISNKDRCFLEIQHHDVDEQIKYNKMLYNLSKSTGLRLIVGTDTHALNEDHMKARAILQKAKGVNFADEASWDLTLKTPNGLLAAYKKQHSLPLDVVIEAMQESVKMADMVEPFEVDRKPKYPKLYGNPEEVFRKKIQDGIAYRHIMEKPNFQEYLDRIEYEFDTYKHNDAIDFMLLEEDYKSEMRRRNVRFGYSRGSVSGSIIAYLLGITEVDSIKYNLNFERFMNKERVSLADVDTDWLSEDRKIVKDYLYTKQGLYCCDIVTFNTIALKGAIKDICRGLYKDNISRLPEELKAEVDKWDKQSKKNKNKSSTNAIPYPEELIKKIEKSSIHKEVPFAYLRRAEEVISLFESDEKAARRKYPEIFYYVDLVNGVIVSVGNHPAGCVVSPYPVNEWFGTFTTSTDEYPISMINMKEVDSLNFVKLDILGLDNIGLIYKTCDAAGIPFLTPDNTPPDDVDVWNSIRDDTTMIFQWESPSATAYLKQLFSDSTIEKIRSKNPNFSYMDLLSIGNGAIRPAGDSYREELSKGIYRDNGHKALNDFLAPTLGYLVYQEQIIEFLHRFCGYTMGQADIVRRGFSKKLGTEKFVPTIKSGFIKTMEEEYGVVESKANELIVNFIQVIEDASSYLFSKNHSDPYSWIGYICGYLRYYYPLEFVTTALNIFESKTEKTASIVEYAKKHGIKICPIKFRHSRSQYSFDKSTNSIFKGTASIKYLGSGLAEGLYELRDEKFENFFELLDCIASRKIASKSQIAILIKLNFFEEFGNINALLFYLNVYDEFSGAKQIAKTKLSKFGIPVELVSNCFEKETEKQFRGFDETKFFSIIGTNFHIKKESISEIVKYQQEYLGYIDYINPEMSKVIYVLDVNTKYSPKLTVYSLKNGTTTICKVRKRLFRTKPIEANTIIRVKSTEWEDRYIKNENGESVPVEGEKELWITDYSLINL